MRKIAVALGTVFFLCSQVQAESLEETVKVLVDANVILSDKILSLEERVKRLENTCLKAKAPRTSVRTVKPNSEPSNAEGGWYYLATFEKWRGREKRIKREFEQIARRVGIDIYYYIGPTKGYLVIVSKLTPSQLIKVKKLGLSPLKVKTKLPEMFSIENL